MDQKDNNPTKEHSSRPPWVFNTANTKCTFEGGLQLARNICTCSRKINFTLNSKIYKQTKTENHTRLTMGECSLK